MANRWKNSGNNERLYIFGVPKSLHMVTAAMRRLLLGRKVMTNLDSILKSRDITLPTKVYQFSPVQLLSRVRLFATPWTAACQASLSITNSQSLLKLMSIESVIPSNHLILCHPLLLLPSIFPSIRVFSDESAHHIWWPKYWSYSFNISLSSEHPGLISFRMMMMVQKHQFLCAQLSL